MTSEICLPRSLTSVSSSTAQKVRSRQHFPRRIKEEIKEQIKEQLRTLIFVIYWFSHYCNFIETNISSFIIMSYHKKIHLALSSFIISLKNQIAVTVLPFLHFSGLRDVVQGPGYSFRAYDFPRRDRTRTIVCR